MKTVATSKPRGTSARPVRHSSRLAGLAGSIGRGLSGFARRRPGVVFAVAAVIAGGGAFSWNVLSQSGRHPAPLFASRPDPAAIEPPRRPDTFAQIPAPQPAVAPPARPAEPALARVELPRPEVARRETPPARPAAGGDPIGAMIRASDSSAKINELAKAGETGKPAPDPSRVAAVQRALTKLGYGPLRDDGIMGTGTRQAIERFEREKNLPVSGALPVRTVRQLAALSGVAVE